MRSRWYLHPCQRKSSDFDSFVLETCIDVCWKLRYEQPLPTNKAFLKRFLNEAVLLLRGSRLLFVGARKREEITNHKTKLCFKFWDRKVVRFAHHERTIQSTTFKKEALLLSSSPFVFVVGRACYLVSSFFCSGFAIEVVSLYWTTCTSDSTEPKSVYRSTSTCTYKYKYKVCTCMYKESRSTRAITGTTSPAFWRYQYHGKHTNTPYDVRQYLLALLLNTVFTLSCCIWTIVFHFILYFSFFHWVLSLAVSPRHTYLFSSGVGCTNNSKTWRTSRLAKLGAQTKRLQWLYTR
jgi:hypothetical protein